MVFIHLEKERITERGFKVGVNEKRNPKNVY